MGPLTKYWWGENASHPRCWGLEIAAIKPQEQICQIFGGLTYRSTGDINVILLVN